MEQNNLNFNNANYEKKSKTEEKIYYLNFKINFFLLWIRIRNTAIKKIIYIYFLNYSYSHTQGIQAASRG